MTQRKPEVKQSKLEMTQSKLDINLLTLTEQKLKKTIQSEK